MYYRFEKLEVWKEARGFVVDVYKLTEKFPKSELFGLISQIRTSYYFNNSKYGRRK